MNTINGILRAGQDVFAILGALLLLFYCAHQFMILMYNSDANSEIDEIGWLALAAYAVSVACLLGQIGF